MSYPPICTLGHSTLEFSAFLQILRMNSIGCVGDVRSMPGSRRNPQYGKETLAAALASAGIDYCHLPLLGGLRRAPKPPLSAEQEQRNGAWRNASFRNYAHYMQTDGFQEGLDQLARIAACRRTVIVCCEALWWQCHRSLIADAWVAKNGEVTHLSSAGASARHQLRNFARADETKGTVFYPAEQLVLKFQP